MKIKRFFSAIACSTLFIISNTHCSWKPRRFVKVQARPTREQNAAWCTFLADALAPWGNEDSVEQHDAERLAQRQQQHRRIKKRRAGRRRRRPRPPGRRGPREHPQRQSNPTVVVEPTTNIQQPTGENRPPLSLLCLLLNETLSSLEQASAHATLEPSAPRGSRFFPQVHSPGWNSTWQRKTLVSQRRRARN